MPTRIPLSRAPQRDPFPRRVARLLLPLLCGSAFTGLAGAAASGPAAMAHSGHGPAISAASIPAPAAGFADVRLKPTQEQPTESDIGAFRTACEVSHFKRDDPIVFPGQPGASHLHMFFGNTGTDAYSTAASLARSGNSTCRGGLINRSSYWVPAMLDEHGKVVKPTGMLVYYKRGYLIQEPTPIEAPPPGLRMVAGNAKATTEAQGGASYECIENWRTRKKTIVNCANTTLLMSVGFPQCWNGRDLDSPDHQRHMAYPVQKQSAPFNWSCPPSHPVAIPDIVMQFHYAAPATGTAGWRLASDMYDASLPGGASGHADWFNGWREEIMKVFVKHCIMARKDCHAHLLGDGREMY